MTTITACIRGCLTRDHLAHCTDDSCHGCRPARTLPGLLVCGHDVETVRTALRRTDETPGRIRADQLGLPNLWDAVADASVLRAKAPGGGTGDGRPIPLDADAAAWRDRVRACLVGWCRILHEDFGASLNDAEDTVAWMAARVLWHADRLLAHPEHADQLVSDLDGWTEDTPDGPIRHEGVATEGRRLTFRSRSRAVRIRCTCGAWLPVELDGEGRVDQAATIRCQACGEHGVLSWWRQMLAPHADPLSLRLLPEWLLTVHAIAVTERRLRDWADEGVITPLATDGVAQGGGRPRRLFDPVAVAAVAQAMTAKRKARTA